MCDYCTANGGAYDLTQRCCRARFTAQPGHNRTRRQAWCDFWRKVFPAEEAEATIDLAKQIYAGRKA